MRNLPNSKSLTESSELPDDFQAKDHLHFFRKMTIYVLKYEGYRIILG